MGFQGGQGLWSLRGARVCGVQGRRWDKPGKTANARTWGNSPDSKTKERPGRSVLVGGTSQEKQRTQESGENAQIQKTKEVLVAMTKVGLQRKIGTCGVKGGQGS